MILRCDFCEERSPSAGFDPDWDAIVCDKCTEAMAEDLKKIRAEQERRENGN
jgi:hypothetical protein